MTNWLTRLVNDTNGRPLTLDEAEAVADYAETLPDRLAAAKKVEDGQKWLTRHLSDYVAPKAAEWGLPKDPFSADLAGCLTAVCHAMVANEPALVDATVAAPFAALADALEVPREAFAELFDETWKALGKRLDPRSAELLAPAFSRVVYQLRVAAGWPASAASASAHTPVEV